MKESQENIKKMKKSTINQVVPIDNDGQRAPKNPIIIELAKIQKELSDEESNSARSRPVTDVHSNRIRNLPTENPLDSKNEKSPKTAWETNEKSNKKKWIKILISVIIGIIVLGGVALIGVGALGKLTLKVFICV